MTAAILQAQLSQPYREIPVGILAAGERQRPREPLGESVFVRAGTPLYRQEDDATYLYKVVKGTVRAFTFTEDGRRQVNGFHFSGDTFGSGQSGHYRSSVEAITDCTLVRFRRRKQEIDPNPGFDLFVLGVALAEIRAAEEQILLLGRMSACSKVAAFLLYLAEHLSLDERPGMVVSITMTRYDIADFLGLSAESVSRCLTKLKQRGLIEMDMPDEITLVGPERLSDIPRGF